MNLDDYKYNGFKLYRIVTTHQIRKNETIENVYDIIVQYKNGIEFKSWSQEVLMDTESLEEWDRWMLRTSSHFEYDDKDFVRNLSEEEVFGILL